MSITGLYIRNENFGYDLENKMGTPFLLMANSNDTDGNIPYASVYIDGSYYSKCPIYRDSLYGPSGPLLMEGPEYFPDLSDNKKSYNIEFVYGSYSVSQKIYLPDAVKIDSISDRKLGSTFYIDLIGIAKGFQCKLYLSVGSFFKFIKKVTYEDARNQSDLLPTGGILLGYEEKMVAEYSLANNFKSSISETVKILCYTYNGTEQIGLETEEFRVTVPENDITKPAIDSVKFSPITSCTDALAQLYIRGKTGLNVQISAKSAYSDIAEYEVTAGSVGAKGNPGIIDVLANDGNVPVTVKVTDARGFSRTVTENIYVYPYSRPKIVPYTGYSDIVCERAKATGELHSDGTYLAIMAGKRFTSIVKDGAELNSCRLRYRFKPTTVDTFGDWVTLLADGSGESEIQMLAGNVVSNTNASYDIELSAIDLVGSEHVIRFSVMTSAISFVLYDGVDGAAFGKYPEEPHVVDIASHMTLRVRGRLEVLGSSWESLGLADGMNESPYAYGRQDDTGCYYQVSNGNHVQAAFNCSYDYAGRSMVVNKTPIPEEYRPERTVCSICPTNDRRLALVTVQPDGYIRIEWVQTIASTSDTASATVLWVDGYLDYWV